MQIQRAYSGGIAAAELFRERGISAMLGFEAGASYSAKKTQKVIEDAFANGTTTVKGAAKSMADTFYWSSIHDAGRMVPVEDAVSRYRLN